MHKKLLQNTIYLYVLQFSVYFFNFITVPYQTRVLGPEVFGTLSFASTFMIYLQLIIDFGFILYATGLVAKSKEDSRKMSDIFSAVTTIKVLMSLTSLLVIVVGFVLFPNYFGNFWLFFIFTIGTIFGGLIPDYIYRGLEETKYIALRTFFVKLIFTVLVFIFLRSQQDYMVVPILNGLGNLIALIWAVTHLSHKFNISFKTVSRKFLKKIFAGASKFFLSRIASTIYGASNTIILRAIYGESPVIGYFTSSDKLVNTGKSALSPIADSVYPHMIKNKDFRLIKKVLLITTPITLIIAVFCFVFAENICLILFGKDFVSSAGVLRAFTPMMVTTLPMYLLGFPTLSSVGLSDHANKSIVYGLIVHIVFITILFIFNAITAENLAISASSSEFFILISRGIIFYKYRKGIIKK